MSLPQFSLVHGSILSTNLFIWYFGFVLVLATKQTLLSIVLVSHPMLRPIPDNLEDSVAPQTESLEILMNQKVHGLIS